MLRIVMRLIGEELMNGCTYKTKWRRKKIKRCVRYVMTEKARC